MIAAGWLLTAMNGVGDPAEDPRFFFHRLFKRVSYSEITRQAADDIRAGKAQPLLPFIVEESPASIFIHFEVRADRLAALFGDLNLPPGFAPAEVSVTADDPPRHLISLNIYAVSGLGGTLSGNRAEWSVYVSKDGGRPSFMVVEARSSAFSLDSVSGFTRATRVDHSEEAGGIQSFVVSEGGTTFSSLIPSTALDAATGVLITAGWAACNDRIYWTDGVADRVYYDGQLTDTPLLAIDPGALIFSDTTRWRSYVHPQPVAVHIFQTGLEFVISPWFNLDAP
jgi:hypothetical protein